jgi:threonine aldolase
MTALRHFASDNNAGAHPEILAAIAEANAGHVRGYGDDPYTEAAAASFRQHFGSAAESFLVFNGTGANVLGLKAVTEPHQAIICADGAHVAVDECGAPERFTGCKLLLCPTDDGKLRPADIERHLHWEGDEHRVQPRVVSVSQATELGTVYRPEELRALADLAHRNGMLLHLDGARIANAAVSLALPFRAFTTDAGVDVVSFGLTKNGALAAEAVVFPQGPAPAAFKYIRKQGLHLASKMRFLAAQVTALLGTDLWERNAGQANRMARRLADRVAGIPGVTITQPVEANGVFARVPPRHIPALQAVRRFYLWNAAASEVRWMTAWDTTEADVDQFAGEIRRILAGGT